MTDRLKGCVVAFERDIREDDAEHILNAIRCIRGVASVEGDVEDPSDWMARQRVRSEIHERLVECLDEVILGREPPSKK